MSSTNTQSLDLPNSLQAEQMGPVLVVQLTRPAKRNALSDSTMLGLERIFANIPGDVGAVVLHGEGDHFCAGLDLNELSGHDTVDGVLHARMWQRVFDCIQFGRVPVVAALQGAVIGGGLELACAAHIRVAEPSTFYALPEGQRGIFVGGGGSVRVPKLIGLARMADMLLTGRVFPAEEGYKIGLAQYLVEAGAGLGKALELANKIAGNTRMTNFAILHALPRIAETSQDTGLMLEALMSAVAQSAPEAQQRVEQFLNKRAKSV